MNLKNKRSFLGAVFLAGSLSACGGGSGGGGGVEADPNVIEPVTPPLVISPTTTTYKLSIQGQSLSDETDTSSVSIGVYDGGFRTDHVEIAGRAQKQNYVDEYALNSDLVSGVYTEGVAPPDWEWASHGTAVASAAAGAYSGLARQSEIVTSMNRFLISSFDSQEYVDGLGVDSETGFLRDDWGTCLREIVAFPWCVTESVFHAKKIKEVSTKSMPAINFSFTNPFGSYVKDWDLSYERWTSLEDPIPFYDDWSEAYNLVTDYQVYRPSLEADYLYIRDFLSSAETVIVVAAGNDGASITQEQVMNWKYMTENSVSELAPKVVNTFYDPDVDADGDGQIEPSERGITNGLLFVGSLDEFNESSWFSNYPGSSVKVQERFIMAPGEFSVAIATDTVDYEFGTGTSYAAPLVSGAIALLKANHPDRDAREIAEAMLLTANKGFEGYSPEAHGQGILDVAAANEWLIEN